MNQTYSGSQASSGTVQFSIGSVLSRTLSTLLKNPVVFIGMAVLANIPGLAVELLLPESRLGSGFAQLASAVFSLMAGGAISYGAFQAMKGTSVSFGESLKNGFARGGVLFLTALATGICIGIASLLFLIPGLILTCFWAVTIPACVVERLGVTDSMKRSTSLTEGFRWQIFALILIVGIAIFALAFGLISLLMTITDNTVLGVAVTTLLVCIPQAFSYVMYAVIYYDLRAIKEGITLNHLVSVFE